MTEPLPGYKSYITAGLMLAFAILGVALGQMDASDAGRVFFEALALVNLRFAIQKLKGQP